MIFSRIKINNLLSFKRDYISNFLPKHNILYTAQLRCGFYILLKFLKYENPKKKYIAMSPFTVFEMVNVVINSGFEPLFIDIDQKSFCMSIQSLEKQNNKNICACLFTHHHTNENDYEKILNFCNLNNIYLIEDCATALGTQYKNSNHQVGTLSNYSLFSFGFYKTFNMLYGGALSFSSEKKKLKDFYNDMSSFSNILLLKKFIYYFIFKTLLNKYIYSFLYFH